MSWRDLQPSLSSSLYRGAYPSRGASHDTLLLRWNESRKQQQGKERLWSTIYNNGLRYARTNTHDGLTGTAAVIEHVCVAYYLGDGVSREEKEAKSKYRVLLAVVAGKDE